MQFSIAPVDLHHYDIFLLHPMQSKIFKNLPQKTYVGSATINLSGDRIDVYCEDKRIKNYSEMLGEQAFKYYSANQQA